MREIASPAQLRMSLLRWALVLVPLVLLLGTASGVLAGSGSGNAWYAALRKPSFVLPGGAIGAVWTLLYILMGIATAIVASARGARERGVALAVFAVQLALNLAWAPIFFAAHRIALAFGWIVLLFFAAAMTAFLYARIRRLAGLLLLPYLAWLLFAGAIAFEVMRLNPGVQTLAPNRGSTQIPL